MQTNLSGANLSGANLGKARVGCTTFGNLDLRAVKGLQEIHHEGPFSIGTDSVEQSQGDIPSIFLREAGSSETFITYAHSLTQSPIQYYTCFISYSSKDQKFAERLRADLLQQGIRCSFAPEDLKIGQKFPNRIEEAIRLSHKLLIILSQNSIHSSWVEDEARAALEKEARLKKNQPDTTVLFPIKIDTSIEQGQSQWVAKLRRERHIGDFTRWTYHTRYEKAFQRLIRDLQPDQQ